MATFGYFKVDSYHQFQLSPRKFDFDFLPAVAASSLTDGLASPHEVHTERRRARQNRQRDIIYIMHLFFLVLPAVQGMCAGWCSPALCSSVWKCMACPMCLSPPSPPAPPQPPPDPSAPWLAADLAPSELDRHDYARALQLSLLFYRAQRSGDLSGTGNPIPYRTAPPTRPRRQPARHRTCTL